MIKLRVIAVGKDKDRWVTQAVDHYVKLLSRYAQIELSTLTVNTPATLSDKEIKRAEADALSGRMTKGTVIALSDKGAAMDSRAFAAFLERLRTTSAGTVSFIIGGPLGLDSSILERVDHVLSLSPMTFPHQLVRPILLEQLYRAFSISHGTAYHK